MAQQVELNTRSRQAIHMALCGTFLLVGAYFAALTFRTPIWLQGTLLFVLFGVVAGAGVCVIAREPRTAVFHETEVELRAAICSIILRDGQLESVRPALLGRWHRGSRPTRVTLRYRRGARTIWADSRQFGLLIAELRRRNPAADIDVP